MCVELGLAECFHAGVLACIRVRLGLSWVRVRVGNHAIGCNRKHVGLLRYAYSMKMGEYEAGRQRLARIK